MKFWYQQHSWCKIFLTPFAWIYHLIVIIHRVLYRWKILKTQRLPVPVIVVGNLVVGGTGKTPLVATIANYFQAQGFKVGLVSRGYGGRAKTWPQRVTASSSADMVGDEPVMLVQQTGLPMVVGPNRVQAAQQLLQKNACNLIISDDGLQHYALARDVEILVMDGYRRCGNGALLPAGPLRESARRIKAVDFVLVKMSPSAHLEKGEIPFKLVAQEPYNLIRGKNNTQHSLLGISKKVHAIAAIGYPEQFFMALTNLGFEVIPHVFSDHAAVTLESMQFEDDLPIVLTEKNAVHCMQFVTERYWALPVVAEVAPEFLQVLQTKIQ